MDELGVKIMFRKFKLGVTFLIIVATQLFILSITNSYGSVNSKETIKLTIDVVKKEYIYGTFPQIKLSLKLNFVNISKHDQLLYKHSILPSQLLVSQNCPPKNCQVLRDIRYNSDIVFDTPETQITKEDFVLLKSGDSYQIDSEVRVPKDDGIRLVKDTIYQFKIILKTIYGNEIYFKRIQKKYFKGSQLVKESLQSPWINFMA